MSLAEVVAGSLAAFLAAAPIVAYLIDAVGAGLMPVAVLAVSIAISLAVAWSLIGDARRGPANHLRQGYGGQEAGRHIGWADLFAWTGVVAAVAAWLLRIGSPSLLPPGSGSDLTHHLLLVDYIERAGHLVHDRSLEAAMGEMAHYTPGAHLLAMLFGAWTGTDGFRAFYSVIAVGTALTAGFVFLISRRLRLPAPFAVASVLLLLLPLDYFTGAFTHDAFLAQAVCASLAVAAWWALVAWNDQPTAARAALLGLLLTATFLAWPVWIGPPLLVFAALLLRRHASLGWRIRHFAIAMAPLVAVAGLHISGRLGWTLLVRTSGAVLQPSLAVVGWVFPLLALIGLTWSIATGRALVTVAFLLAVVVQATTLWFMSGSIGAETPYMAYKMGYLAIYPLAIFGALALHAVVSRAALPVQSAAGWLMASVMVVAIAQPAINAPRSVPAVSIDLYDAGRWLRANAGAGCADYLVGSADTAYWLHLAVLGNPRASARTAEIDRYDSRAEIGRWVAGDGQGYAVADLRLLPDELRSRVVIVERFGNAAVIRRGDAGQPPCEGR